MEKLDLRKELKYLYGPSATSVELVDVPEFQFVVIDGTIPEGLAVDSSPEFQDAMGALYGASFSLKFMSKLRKANPIDYAVMASEGLWWTDSGAFDFAKLEPRHFTMMIMQPTHVTEEMFKEAVLQVKKKRDSPALARLRFEPFHEGLSIQIMHVGPYSEETATLAKMQAFASENGYIYRGRHHEIYLGNPRRAKPEKLKTVLRHAVERAP